MLVQRKETISTATETLTSYQVLQLIPTKASYRKIDRKNIKK